MVIPLLGDDSIVTAGSETLDVPSERFWCEELSRLHGRAVYSTPAGRTVRARRRKKAREASSGDSHASAANGASPGRAEEHEEDADAPVKIPVVVYSLAIKNATAPDRRGLLQPLLRRWQIGCCGDDVFGLPAVQAVIDWKWARYARHLLLWQLGMYVCWMASFFAFTVLFQDEGNEKTLRELLRTSRGKATVTLDLLSLLFMMPFVAIEVASYAAYGFAGWFSAWNALDMATYVLQIIISILHLSRATVGGGSGGKPGGPLGAVGGDLPDASVADAGAAPRSASLLGLPGMAVRTLLPFHPLLRFGDATNLVSEPSFAFDSGASSAAVDALSVASSTSSPLFLSLSVCCAAQCIFLLFRLQYFSRVFRATRFAFVDDLVAVVKDVKTYLLFLSLVVFGWAAAFHILFRSATDQKTHPEFASIGMSCLTMLNWVAGNMDMTPLSECANPAAAVTLGIGFTLVISTVLMNLLVGILCNSLQRVTDEEGRRALVSKAQAIDEIDAVIPERLERILAKWGWYPPYLQILRVDPERLDAVDLEGIWGLKETVDQTIENEHEQETSEQDDGEDQKANAGAEAGQAKALAALEDRVKALSAEIERLTALLSAQKR